MGVNEAKAIAVLEENLEIVRKMGYHYFVDMHVEVNPQMTVMRSHEIAHQVKDNIRQRIPTVFDVLVHIEPTGQTPAIT